MFVGMGTVFAFLTALVIAMTLMSAIVRRLQPDVAIVGISNEEIAAIGAAIRQYRRKQADKTI